MWASPALAQTHPQARSGARSWWHGWPRRPHPSTEPHPLAARVCDGVAVGELLPAIQRDALRVRPHEGALSHSRSPGQTRIVCGALVEHHGVRGRQAPLLLVVDLHAVRVREHQAHAGMRARARATRSQLINWKLRLSERRELVAVPARSRSRSVSICVTSSLITSQSSWQRPLRTVRRTQSARRGPSSAPRSASWRPAAPRHQPPAAAP